MFLTWLYIVILTIFLVLIIKVKVYLNKNFFTCFSSGILELYKKSATEKRVTKKVSEVAHNGETKE